MGEQSEQENLANISMHSASNLPTMGNARVLQCDDIPWANFELRSHVDSSLSMKFVIQSG